MVRLKILRAVMGDGETAVVRTLYATRLGIDGRVTETSPNEGRALLLTDADALRVASHYRKREKPGKFVYEEVRLAPPG
jgi:hypothetical protein